MNRSRRILGAGLFGTMALVLMSAGCGGGGSASPDGAAGTTGTAAHGGAGSSGTTGSAGTGVSSTATTGVDGCKNLVQVLCTRDRSCNTPDAGADEVTHCQSLEEIGLGCDRAAGLDFGECISDVKAVSCTTLFSSAPASCSGPLGMIPASPAVMKCADFASTVCEKSASCSATAVTSDDVLACEQSLYDDLGCDFATGVGATYDQCLMDVKNLPCKSADAGTSDPDAGTSIPSCDTALTFPQ